jgi:enoyl-CoA hydratase
VALSDIVYLAPGAYLADPHVSIGLVAADCGPLTWPLHTSLLWAKEYAFTGARIPAAAPLEMGLANHVVPDPLTEAVACARPHRGAAAAGGRVDQAHPQPAPGARRPGDDRLCDDRGEASSGADDFRTTITQLTEKLTEEKKS